MNEFEPVHPNNESPRQSRHLPKDVVVVLVLAVLGPPLFTFVARGVFFDDSTWSGEDRASFRAITRSIGMFLASYPLFRFAAIASANDQPRWKAAAWLSVGGVAVLIGIAELVSAIIARS